NTASALDARSLGVIFGLVSDEDGKFIGMESSNCAPKLIVTDTLLAISSEEWGAMRARVKVFRDCFLDCSLEDLNEALASGDASKAEAQHYVERHNAQLVKETFLMLSTI